jgi:hypothetical protein
MTRTPLLQAHAQLLPLRRAPAPHPCVSTSPTQQPARASPSHLGSCLIWRSSSRYSCFADGAAAGGVADALPLLALLYALANTRRSWWRAGVAPGITRHTTGA